MFNLTKLNQLNKICSASTVNVTKRIKKNARHLSTKVAVKTDPLKELIKDIEKISKITTKEIIKKPQKPPFAKNLFLGIYDTDILTYPEVLDKEVVDQLQSSLQPVEEFFQGAQQDGQRRISRQYLENLSRLKLLGLQVPSVMGCRQLSLTEACRFYEVFAQNTSRTSVILNEVLGIQTLLKNGSEMLKKKYLEALVDGKTLVACCVSEAATSDPRALRTSATLSDDKKSWILNGEKTWIVNGDSADLFIVFAEAKVPKQLGIEELKTVVFLVERSFGGVTSKPCEFMGLDETDVSDVIFQNTHVPIENVIGDVNKGEDIMKSILPEFRLSVGPMCTSILRQVINSFTKHCVEVDDTRGNISTTEAVQSRLGQMITVLYAMESMTFLTAALIDEYENQDCELETAIVKAFSAEHCHHSALKCMDFIGSPAYMNDHWCNRLYRDALSHLLLNESADSTKLVVALLGVQYAGFHSNAKIKMIRNPLFHPAAMFRRMWDQRKHIEDNPKLNLKLREYLHPSLISASDYLEYCVLRLQFATESLLARYGPDVVSKHIDLMRLADCVIDVYAMTAVLGRASRSYCIGLQHANLEIYLANAFCVSAKDRVRDNVSRIWAGAYNTADESYLRLGKQVFKSGQYFAEHPLTRNF